MSLQASRLNRMPEAVYLEKWKKHNKRQPGLNYGYTYLELILCPSDIPGFTPPPVSDRDAEVAACIIQWLGTCCGLSFMSECEREVKVREKEDADRYRRNQGT